MKKGQVTTFIIIGLVILLIASLLFFLVGKGKDLQELPQTDEQKIKNYIEDCIEDTVETGVKLQGLQGGNIYLSDKYLTTDYSEILYSYYKGKNTLLTLEDMESDLSAFISQSLPFCVNWSTFPDYNITAGDISTDTEILENNIIFTINYDITAKKDEAIFRLNQFRYSSDIRVGYIYNIVKEILEKTLIDPDWIDLTYLSEFDANIELLPYNDSVLVYSMTDNSPEDPYTFLTALSFKENKPPIIRLPDEIEWQDGLPLIYQVPVLDPEGDPFTCSDDTVLFDITEDCQIIFTPEIPGQYDVTITVEDMRGNAVHKKVKFQIKE